MTMSELRGRLDAANPRHYSNIAREPHAGDRVRHLDTGREWTAVFGAPAMACDYDLVTPWWAVDAKPGAQVRDRYENVWTLRDNWMWSTENPIGNCDTLPLDCAFGPCEPVEVKTPNVPDEPTSTQVKMKPGSDSTLPQRVTVLPEVTCPDPDHPLCDDICANVAMAPCDLTGQQVETVRAVADHVDDECGDGCPALDMLHDAFPGVFIEESEVARWRSGDPQEKLAELLRVAHMPKARVVAVCEGVTYSGLVYAAHDGDGDLEAYIAVGDSEACTIDLEASVDQAVTVIAPKPVRSDARPDWLAASQE